MSKESPFLPKGDVQKQIMLESVEFSKKRNPLKINPKDNPMSKSLQVYAGTITDFGRQLLKLEEEGGSPGIKARKAKLITSIKLIEGDYEPPKKVEGDDDLIDHEIRAFQESIPQVSQTLRVVLGKVAPASRQVNTKWARAQNIPQFLSPQAKPATIDFPLDTQYHQSNTLVDI